MPQFDAATFLPQLVWLALIFGALYAAITWTVVPLIQRVLDARAHHLQAELQRAQDLLDHAEAVRLDVETRLKAAQDLARAHFDAALEAVTAENAKEWETFEADMRTQLEAMDKTVQAQALETEKMLPQLAEQVAQNIVQKLTGASVTPKEMKAALRQAQADVDLAERTHVQQH